jgi:hypothetical protein
MQRLHQIEQRMLRGDDEAVAAAAMSRDAAAGGDSQWECSGGGGHLRQRKPAVSTGGGFTAAAMVRQAAESGKTQVLHSPRTQHQQHQQPLRSPRIFDQPAAASYCSPQSAVADLLDTKADAFAVASAWLRASRLPKQQQLKQPPLAAASPQRPAPPPVAGPADSPVPQPSPYRQQWQAAPARATPQAQRPPPPRPMSPSAESPVFSPIQPEGADASSPSCCVHEQALSRFLVEAVAAERRQLVVEREMMAERLRGTVLETALIADALAACGGNGRAKASRRLW